MQSKFSETLTILKGKVLLCTTPSRRMGEWSYSSTILDLSTRWRWVVSFTPRPLCPREVTTGTHWIGGWVGPKVRLNAVEQRRISCPYREDQAIAYRQYRLSYRTPYRRQRLTTECVGSKVNSRCHFSRTMRHGESVMNIKCVSQFYLHLRFDEGR
jgi:hypothetical protein